MNVIILLSIGIGETMETVKLPVHALAYFNIYFNLKKVFCNFFRTMNLIVKRFNICKKLKTKIIDFNAGLKLEKYVINIQLINKEFQKL